MKREPKEDKALDLLCDACIKEGNIKVMENVFSNKELQLTYAKYDYQMKRIKKYKEEH